MSDRPLLNVGSWLKLEVRIHDKSDSGYEANRNEWDGKPLRCLPCIPRVMGVCQDVCVARMT